MLLGIAIFVVALGVIFRKQLKALFVKEKAAVVITTPPAVTPAVTPAAPASGGDTGVNPPKQAE